MTKPKVTKILNRPELHEALDDAIARLEMNDSCDLRAGLTENIEVRVCFWGQYTIRIVEDK